MLFLWSHVTINGIVIVVLFEDVYFLSAVVYVKAVIRIMSFESHFVRFHLHLLDLHLHKFLLILGLESQCVYFTVDQTVQFGEHQEVGRVMKW